MNIDLLENLLESDLEASFHPEFIHKMIAVIRAAEPLETWADDYDNNPLLENLRAAFKELRKP